MAVWNVVRSSTLSRTFRIDPEYYQLHYLQLLERLKRAGSQRLSNVVDVIKDKFRPQTNNSFEYIEISRVSTTLGTYETIQVPDDEAPSRAQYLVPKGTVLLSTVRPNRNAVALVTNPSARTVCSSGFLVLKPRHVSPEYLFAFLKTRHITELLIRETTATMYPAVAEEDVLALPFLEPAPSIHEQVRSFVSKANLELDRSAQFYSQAESLLLAELGLDKIDLSPSLFFEACYSDTVEAGRLDAEYFQPKYDRLLGLIEQTGQSVRLGDYLQEPPRRGIQPEYSDEGDIIVINSQHVGKNGVILDGNRKTDRGFLEAKGKGRVNQYDVLLNSTGYITIGRAQTLLEDVKAIVDSHITILRPKPPLDPVYLGVFLNSPAGFLQTERNWTGSSGQIELRKEAIAGFRIWLAPLSVQGNIREYIEKSHAARQESKRLIDKAVRLVEEAILGQGQ